MKIPQENRRFCVQSRENSLTKTDNAEAIKEYGPMILQLKNKLLYDQRHCKQSQ